MKPHIYSVSNSYETSEAFSFLHSYLIDFEIVFKDYVRNGAGFANEKISLLDYKLQESYKEGKEQAEIFYQHDYVREKLQYFILENAFIIANIGYLYSQLDLFLKEISELTKSLFNSKIGLKEYHNKAKKNNNDLIKSKFYLTDTYKIDFSSIEPLWIEIMNFKKVRNLVIHHNNVYFKDSEFISYIKSKDSVEIIEHSLKFGQEYLHEVIELIVLFVNKTMELIYTKYKQLK